MTGGGAATLAFGKESTFKGSLIDSDSDGTPEYYAFGRNPSVTEADLQNQLQRMREAGLVEAAESVKQNFEGAVTIEAVVSADVMSDVHDVVFNDAGTGFAAGRPASAKVYTGIDYLDGTTERELSGCIPLEFAVTYEQGGMVSYTLTMAYATENKATSITPTSVVQATDGSSVAWHGEDVTIDATTVSKMQSATLTISNISRFQRGGQTEPVDAVIAAPETTLDVTAIFSGDQRLELAYGGSGSTTPQESMTSVTGSVALTTAGGTAVATYDLPKLKPDSYSWADLVDAETDLTEPTTFHANGGVTVS